MENGSNFVQIEQKDKLIEIKNSSKLDVDYSEKIEEEEEVLSPSGTESQSTTEELSMNEREERLEQKWKKPPTQSNFVLVQEMLERGLSASQILQSLIGSECKVPDDISESVALRLLIQFVGERRFRNRLPQFNDFTHAVELFKSSKNILIISGAGVSTSCGIPDFRSAKGIYASLKQTFPDLPHPTAMFDIDYFEKRPQPFYSFAKEIFPGAFKPSVSHMFIKFLEDEKKLLRNYTQNIDTLERLAGITKHVECHGSFGSATCLQCDKKYSCDEIRKTIYEQKVARCQECGDGLIKPDIVFFGENLPDHFHMQMAQDKDDVDLLVVIGSSLQVQPVSLIPYNIDDNIPQILINKEDLSSYSADIKLIGDCDSIIVSLCMAIGGKFKDLMLNELKSRSSSLLTEVESLLNSNPDSIFPAVMSEDEIKRQMEEESTQNEKDDEEDKEEIPTKRQKIDNDEKIENEQSPSSEPTNELDALRQMYEANFIHVASKFKSTNVYAKFMPNLNIFKNADFYYNVDQKSFGPLPRRQPSKSEENDGYPDDDQTSNSSSSNSTQYAESNPELRRSDFEMESSLKRDAESCPPFSPNSSAPTSPLSGL